MGNVPKDAHTFLLEESFLFLSSAYPLPTPPMIQNLQNHFPKSTINCISLPYHESALKNPSPELKVVLEKTTVLITFQDFPNPSNVPKLKVVQLCSAGIEHILQCPLYTDETKRNVVWCSASGIHGPQIGEHVFLTLMTLTHELPRLLELQEKRIWPGWENSRAFHTSHTPVDLTRLSLGILGYGGIGRQVGNIGKSMGMHPINVCTFSRKDSKENRRVPDGAYIVPRTGDREGKVPDNWYSSRDASEWEEFLAKSDILVVTIPLTEDTKHMISRKELSLLGSSRKAQKIEGASKGTFLVNISRGMVIDQAALISALEEGILGGASLDVADPEPLPADSPLWDMENVIITPHISGKVSHLVYLSRLMELLIHSFVSIENGGEAFNKIDRKRGY